jgi:hypothetical protein
MSDSGSGFDDWEDIPTEPTAPAAAAAAPIAAAASAPEELVYSTVLDEDDMATLEIWGDRAAFTPRDIRQYIADHYNPPQPRGGGRNHKYVRVEDQNTFVCSPVTNKNFADREVFDECRELLLSQPLYRRLSREGQKKLLVRFVRFCDYGRQRTDACIEGAYKDLYHPCKYYLDEFMPRYAQRGSIL